MICNKCGQEMPEIGAFCPFCGEPKAQEEEITSTVEETAENATKETTEVNMEETTQESAPVSKPKLWPWIVALVVGGILLLAILVGAIFYGLGVINFGGDEVVTEETEVVIEETVGSESAEPSINDEVAARANDVVATLGNRELTVAELQLYYTNEIYTFLNQYYSYIGEDGLNLSLPLDEQNCPLAEEGTTWQQFFQEMALSSWQSYALLETLMEKDGYVPSEAMQEQLDSMEETILAVAQSYGYEDVQTYLEEQMTPGITLDIYLAFNKAYYTGNEYLDHLYTKEQPSDEEIEAYYLENQQTFADNGIEPEMGLHSAVRHILIQPEGGTTAEDGVTVTYSDEEKAAAYAEAERILQEWKDGEATQESFAALANKYSKDGGSNTTGGLYEGINKDASYVEEFRAWASDAARQEGDVAIVETQFGYHIMYFVSGEDYFTYTVKQQLVAQRVQDILVAAREAYPAQINYEEIILYAPVFG